MQKQVRGEMRGIVVFMEKLISKKDLER